MKVLRLVVFMMVMSGAALLPMQAYGQQEVDPDHFDHPAAQPVQKAKPSVHHHTANHVKTATHHHSGKGFHAVRNS